jgi:ATP-dependent DNA helicase RecG
MYVPRQIKNPATYERLNTLIQSNDGHFIAMQDLKLRGLGDIAKGSTQHGKYKGIVKNVDIDIDALESVLSSLA